MSISSEISRLESAKSDIADAIEEKGVTVPANATLDQFPSLISSIQTTPKIETVTGTFGSSSGWGSYFDFPTGFSNDNSYIIGFEVYNGSRWRAGAGFSASTDERVFIERSSNGIRAYSNESTFFDQPFHVILMKI